jgi:hypothetical protein
MLQSTKNTILTLCLLFTLSVSAQYQQNPSSTFPFVKIDNGLSLPYLLNSSDTCIPFLPANDSILHCIPLSQLKGSASTLQEILNGGSTYLGDSTVTLSSVLKLINSNGQTIFKTDFGQVEIGERLDSINSLTPLTVYAIDDRQDALTLAGNDVGGVKMNIHGFDPANITKATGTTIGAINFTTPYFDTINQRAQVGGIFCVKTDTGRSALIGINTTNNRGVFPDVKAASNVVFRQDGSSWFGNSGAVFNLYKSDSKIVIQSDSLPSFNPPLLELRDNNDNDLDEYNARWYQHGNFEILRAPGSIINSDQDEVLELSSINGNGALQLKNLNNGINATAGTMAGKLDFATTWGGQHDTGVASIHGYYAGSGINGLGGLAFSMRDTNGVEVKAMFTPSGSMILSNSDLTSYTLSTALPSDKTLQVLDNGGALISGELEVSERLGIGTQATNSHSSLHLSDSTKGFLMNRMSTNQRQVLENPSFGSGINADDAGLMLYDTDEAAPYYWDGSTWAKLGQSGGTVLESLTLSNDSLAIKLSNDTISAIDLSSFLDNTDAQTLNLSGNNLTVSNGNTVDLGILQDGTGTDDQLLSMNGSMLRLENGDSVSLAGFLDNTDDQKLSLNGNMLRLEEGDSVNLSGYLDNTDAQTLSLVGSDLTISNGGTVDLSVLQDGTGTDDQELQNFTLNGTTLSIEIENGNSLQLDIAPILAPLQNENQTQQALIDDLIARVQIIESCACGGTLKVAEPDGDERIPVPVLHQNIPNPTNGSTSIGFFLPHDTKRAVMIIYSNNGQVVFQKDINSTGEGSIQIEKGLLSRGVYNYSLHVNGKVIDTKKLVVQ